MKGGQNVMMVLKRKNTKTKIQNYFFDNTRNIWMVLRFNRHSVL